MKKTKDLEEIEESGSDSESIELPLEVKPRKTRSDKKEKPEKKPYVYTDARKKQMEIAREIRMQKVAKKKQEKEEQEQEFLAQKQFLEDQKNKAVKLKREKELKKLKKEVSKKTYVVEEERRRRRRY